MFKFDLKIGCFFLALLATGHVRGQVPESVGIESFFKNTGIPAIRNRDRIIDGIVWSGTVTRTLKTAGDANAGESKSILKVEYKRNDKDTARAVVDVVEATSSDSEGNAKAVKKNETLSRVLCSNEKYVFILNKIDGQYEIAHRDASGNPLVKLNAFTAETVMPLSGYVFGIPAISDMANDPKFKIKKAYEIVSEDEYRVKVEFDYITEKNIGSYENCYYVFDVNNHWNPMEINFDIRLNIQKMIVNHNVLIEYKKNSVIGEPPVVKKLVYSLCRYDGSYESKSVYDFDEWKYQKSPNEAFTLRAFGLLETEEAGGK